MTQKEDKDNDSWDEIQDLLGFDREYHCNKVTPKELAQESCYSHDSDS
jgi:hypothetical protein